MANDAFLHISEIQAIAAVPRVLETVAAITGLRFVCIAHINATTWTACAVRDHISYGIRPGDQIDVHHTICKEVHATHEPVVIDDARDYPHEEHIPLLNGFRSYFSVPIFRRDGFYFGNLCGTDPQPRRLSEGPTMATLSLFAELISGHLESERSLRETRAALFSERETAELREQFIAVLGHDLRTPLTSILGRVDLLSRRIDDPAIQHALERIRRSAHRIDSLVSDVVDFTRGRMGSGLALALDVRTGVDHLLEQVVDELAAVYPQARVESAIEAGLTLRCDPLRLAQLLSNLLKNALTHGEPALPVEVRAGIDNELFVLTVTNRGPDLDPAVIKGLFKPYWRAVSRAGDDGLGLGLYIVSQIALGHRGALGVVSSGGRTTFTFSMPAA